MYKTPITEHALIRRLPDERRCSRTAPSHFWRNFGVSLVVFAVSMRCFLGGSFASWRQGILQAMHGRQFSPLRPGLVSGHDEQAGCIHSKSHEDVKSQLHGQRKRID